jgi:hypothetical protein
MSFFLTPGMVYQMPFFEISSSVSSKILALAFLAHAASERDHAGDAHGRSRKVHQDRQKGEVDDGRDDSDRHAAQTGGYALAERWGGHRRQPSEGCANAPRQEFAALVEFVRTPIHTRVRSLRHC